MELGLDQTPSAQDWFALQQGGATSRTVSSNLTAQARLSAAFKTPSQAKPTTKSPAPDTLRGWDWLHRLRRCLAALDNLVHRRAQQDEVLASLEARFPTGVFPESRNYALSFFGPFLLHSIPSFILLSFRSTNDDK